MAHTVKNPPAMQKTQETGVQSLGQEHSPEKDMATHSSNLAWRIPWAEKSGRLQSMGLDIPEQLIPVFKVYPCYSSNNTSFL